MNQIGQSLLPIQPATTKANAPGSADSEATDFGDCFDSFLQQRFDESAEPTPAAVVGTRAEEPVKPTDDVESPDYAMQAEIQALFGLPPAPVEPPGPTLAADAAINEIAPPQSERVVPDTEPSAFIPASKIEPDAMPNPGAWQASRNAPITPPSTPSPRRFDSSAPEPISRPFETRPTSEAPAPGEPSANRDVANVLGIFPPVKLPKPVDVEPAAQTAIPVDVKPAIPVDAMPAATPAPLIGRIDIRSASPSRTPLIAAETFGVTTPIGMKPETKDAPSAIPAAPTFTPPAIPAGQSVQPLPGKIENISVTVPPVDTALASENIAVHSEIENLSGTTAAKPGFEMSATTLQKPQRPNESDSDGIALRDASPEAVPTAGTQTSRNSTLQAAPAQSQHSERELSKREESNAEEKQPAPAITTPFASVPSEATRTTFSEQSTAPIRTSDVQQVVTHTMQAVERLRVSGMERLEVAVKLDNGTDVTIQLRVENGRVTPLIRTESEPLRIALEQNWAQFAQRGGDREARITTPVFESPQTSSNMSDLNQQRDARQQAFKEQAPEFFQMPPPRRNAQHHTPHPIAPASASTERVRLYA